MHAQVPAVFVHVPPTSESYDAESHADDLRQIVASIVRSYGSSTAAGGGASAGGVSSDQAQEADDGAEDKYIIKKSRFLLMLQVIQLGIYIVV